MPAVRIYTSQTTYDAVGEYNMHRFLTELREQVANALGLGISVGEVAIMWLVWKEAHGTYPMEVEILFSVGPHDEVISTEEVRETHLLLRDWLSSCPLLGNISAVSVWVRPQQGGKFVVAQRELQTTLLK